MRVVIAADHAGFLMKNQLRDMLRDEGYEVEDLGTMSSASTDYPDYAAQVARAVASGSADRGVLVCGTGVGMSIAANKIPGIRAAAVSEPVSARLSRQHNDANVVCFGERVVGLEVATDIVHTFLTTEFSGGERHLRRLAKISALE